MRNQEIKSFRKALGLVQELGNAAAVNRQLGASQSLLWSWIIASKLKQGSGVGLAAVLQEKMMTNFEYKTESAIEF
jgi:hypothetical protein